MANKIQICFSILSLILLSGCSAHQLSNALPDSSIPFEESVLLNNSPQPEAIAPENDFVPLPEESIGISVYKNEALGLEIKYLADSPGNYILTWGEQSQKFEIGYAPEDIKSLTVTPWDNNSLFIVCDLTFTDNNSHRYIINCEMLSEVMIHEPMETAGEKTIWEIIERDGTLWLYLNQVSTGISADKRETLEMLGHNIKPLDDLTFRSEEDTFVCDVPLAVYKEEKIGFLRLYYEYDGVGMNCINAEFLPLN